MPMKHAASTALAALLALSATTSGAASIDITPGLWETTMTTTNPMTGQETTKTTTECTEETEFDPRSMAGDTKECQVADELVGDDTLEFSMTCVMDGGAKARFDGRVQADGETSEGEMRMDMQMQGMSMSMQMSWTGRRVGDC